jgi:hypothetical protein
MKAGLHHSARVRGTVTAVEEGKRVEIRSGVPKQLLQAGLGSEAARRGAGRAGGEMLAHGGAPVSAQ